MPAEVAMARRSAKIKRVHCSVGSGRILGDCPWRMCKVCALLPADCCSCRAAARICKPAIAASCLDLELRNVGHVVKAPREIAVRTLWMGSPWLCLFALRGAAWVGPSVGRRTPGDPGALAGRGRFATLALPATAGKPSFM
mmetsp:Transcript_95007/g.305937  ORF Transcript_95007/g.305937 Transcript_95007/m.305937 type:complete len:141 (-) Transcript_95007:1042-1464(-)